jgi:hypothetical protein
MKISDWRRLSTNDFEGVDIPANNPFVSAYTKRATPIGETPTPHFPASTRSGITDIPVCTVRKYQIRTASPAAAPAAASERAAAAAAATKAPAAPGNPTQHRESGDDAHNLSLNLSLHNHQFPFLVFPPCILHSPSTFKVALVLEPLLDFRALRFAPGQLQLEAAILGLASL